MEKTWNTDNMNTSLEDIKIVSPYEVDFGFIYRRSELLKAILFLILVIFCTGVSVIGTKNYIDNNLKEKKATAMDGFFKKLSLN
jgi:hypothetical protein